MHDHALLTRDPRTRPLARAGQGEAARAARTVPAVLGTLAPLLDLAFGIEGEAAFPDEIAALVDRLRTVAPGLSAATPPRPPDPRRGAPVPAESADVAWPAP